MMEQNNTSKADTHAANSRPEIELIKNMLQKHEHSQTINQEGFESIISEYDYSAAALEVQSLIAQEAAKRVDAEVMVFAAGLLMHLAPLMVHRLEPGFPSMTAEIIGQMHEEVNQVVKHYAESSKGADVRR